MAEFTFDMKVAKEVFIPGYGQCRIEKVDGSVLHLSPVETGWAQSSLSRYLNDSMKEVIEDGLRKDGDNGHS